MTIWERVAAALATLNVLFASNQYLVPTGGTLPDLFCVYQLISAPPAQHADNRETLRRYRVQVSIYSRTGLANLPDVAGAMVTAGFARGPMRELPYNQQTQHYGLALDFVYLNEEQSDD